MNRIVVGTLSQANCLTLLDVTVSGACPGRFESDGYKLACLFGCVGSQSQRFLQGHPVGNYRTCRENEHGGRVVPGHNPASAKRDRGSSIAFRGFSNDVLFWKTPEQFANFALLFGVRQD